MTTSLVPKCAGIRLEKIISNQDSITIVVKSIASSALCPLCQNPSQKVHSYYSRRIADLPWSGIAVGLLLHTRKFYCSTLACERKIFTERLPEIVKPYARKTVRLNELLTLIGYVIGGEAGSRLALELGMSVSPDTLIDRIRKAANFNITTPRMLGVDDFAFRKGKRYGTILVDLEKGCVIDLLKDRESSTLEAWLKAHTGIEIVTRDRSSAYAEAIRAGAPDAVQVADRWHLIKNLTEALESLLSRHHRFIRDAANPIVELPETQPQVDFDVNSNPLEVENLSRLPKSVLTRREKRLSLYNEAMELRQKGVPVFEIAKRVGKDDATVYRWIKRGKYKENTKIFPSQLDAYLPYITRRLQEGYLNVRQFWKELKELGYKGAYTSLIAYLHKHNSNLELRIKRRDKPRPVCKVKTEVLIATPSARKTLWMLLKPEKLDEKESLMISNLCNCCPEITIGKDLVISFIEMARQRQADKLNSWIDEVRKSNIAEFKSFVYGLLQDKKAVLEALSSKSSNGQSEGQVNRLKLIKRQMFGRANFDLLKAKVLRVA